MQQIRLAAYLSNRSEISVKQTAEAPHRARVFGISPAALMSADDLREAARLLNAAAVLLENGSANGA